MMAFINELDIFDLLMALVIVVGLAASGVLYLMALKLRRDGKDEDNSVKRHLNDKEKKSLQIIICLHLIGIVCLLAMFALLVFSVLDYI